MEDIKQFAEIPTEVAAQKTSLEERQLRAMCIDFATRIKESIHNEEDLIAIAQAIYDFVTGEK